MRAQRHTRRCAFLFVGRSDQACDIVGLGPLGGRQEGI